jgi:hypothetical protein
MTHRPTSSHTTTSRTLLALAAAASLALGLGTGCLDTGEDDGDLQATVTCPAKIRAWTPFDPNTSPPKASTYAPKEIVSFKNQTFQSRLPTTFTTSPDWFPDIVLSVWLPVTCGNGAPVVDPTPPAAPPANNGGNNNQPPPPPPPAPPPANGQITNGSTSCKFKPEVGAPFAGPAFDFTNGAKNLLNNTLHDQFITAQCQSNADCASGCCALPCGICSGPDASFQAGKQGCGFFDKDRSHIVVKQ